MPSRQWCSATARELMHVTNTRDPRLAMVQLARGLLIDAEIVSPPVNLHLVASFQGVRDIQEVDMPQAGRLIPDGDGLLIQVNARHNIGKRRFTAGHEIGHTLVPAYRRSPQVVQDMSIGLFEGGPEEEHLCDVAAAELVLPERLFRPRAVALGCKLDTVIELSREFNASREATARRVVQMNLWPCAMAVWALAFKRSEAHVPQQMTLGGAEWAPPSRKLRIRYAVASDQFGHYLYPHLSAPPGGCLMRCFTENTVVCGEERLSLSGQDVTLYVMAAPTNFIGEHGPTREVLSLFLAAGSAMHQQGSHERLWEIFEDEDI